MAHLAIGAWNYVRKAAADWLEDKAPQMGAALAFYSVLSLAPLILISLAVAGLYDRSGAKTSFLTQIESTIGTEGKNMIEGMIDHAEQQPRIGTAAAIIGLGMLLLGASGVFGQIQTAMNAIWDVEPKRGGGFWGFIRSRFLSFAMVLGTGFLLIVSLGAQRRDCAARHCHRPLVGRLRSDRPRWQRDGNIYRDDRFVRHDV